MSQIFERTIAGRILTIEIGKLAQQANGAVVVRYGDTVVLVTACAANEPTERRGFVPLTVDYEEKLYAAGKIPGSFFRREGRPTEGAIITCRFIDRCLRPLLLKEFNHELQIIATVLSVDKENDPDICALIGASAALTISDIPFSGPVSAVHIGYIDDNLVLNPTLPQIENCLLDVAVASTRQDIVMVEAGAKEASESLALEAIEFGHEANQEIIKLQKELQQAYGNPKVEVKAREVAPELSAHISTLLGDKLNEALGQPGKLEREQVLASLRDEAKQKLVDSFSEEEVDFAFEARLKAEIRKRILQGKRHVDGRRADEIRPIHCEVGLLPRAHGSGLFARGGTQTLTITTLGSARQEQLLDGLGLAETKRFMHHYNFPPFSSGEVKRVGSPGRREIGHGALGERAIRPILPSEEDFPYTVRLVSEVLSSNGSTSMASTCGSTLSLMDAGVPIKAPVAGIAMGLVTGENGEHVILTDIEGIEDACGDMDFKVAGTSRGITALQLDIKVAGVDSKILAESLTQARQARLEILDKMAQTISTSRPGISPYAPRIHEITIAASKIGNVIGPGGRTIRSITEETKTTIDVRSDGTVIVGSPSEEAVQKAIKMIEDLTQEAKPGDIYTGRVTRLLPFGAMVEIFPGKEGLVHISELADYHVAKVEDVVRVGDEIMVKVIGIDELGRINLSRKAVLEGFSRIPGAKVKDSLASEHRWQRQPNYHHTHSPNKGGRYSDYNK
ncbi:MAG: polyribonucleotide nucleotidyltransferase [Dehalococcoidia bacterium]|nr:polyribonucleotide nucleotidyltransferase [Dehalococcoidia bacterium]